MNKRLEKDYQFLFEELHKDFLYLDAENKKLMQENEELKLLVKQIGEK